MIIKMENSMHYAKEVDDEGNFIRWLPHPEGTYKQKCVKLLEEVEKINQSNFIKGLREQFENRGSLSPRQVECLEKMLKDN